jgi:uncharacterized membrane protein
MQRLAKLLFSFLALGVALYALAVYSLFPLGSLVHPAMQLNFEAHAVGIYIHVFASMLALLLGPLQFAAGLRRKYPQLHRWSGRLYLAVGVLAGGIAGLYMAQFAFGGPIARAGFSLLALSWLYTGVMAYRAICRKNVRLHRQWMLRNYALSFAAVTLRIYLPLSMLSGMPFEASYPIIAWLCWLPNMVIMEWWLRASRGAVAAAAAT